MKEIIEEVVVNIDSKMNEDIYEQALKFSKKNIIVKGSFHFMNLL